ncbi:MAG: 50S ribosome-binding GTPase [Candidatus Omnitrophica bacterium]|nr:50S ribosome-binding GTPase [Candidatus Omnitrophota bacterium]
MIDHIRLTLQAGRGGKGSDSFMSRTDRKVVPWGGDGGSGGNVIFRADTNAPPLSHFRYKPRLSAEAGGAGGSHKKRGKNGKDLILAVPVGTKIFDYDKKYFIRHLTQSGQEVTVLKGGRGGSGNFGGKRASNGEAGESLEIELRILLPADVFLVGLPNSGKSTLLNVLTGSKIKVGEYPFTTRSPELGVYASDNFNVLTLCELPSVYGASHEGRGMGSDFLKHLEVAKAVLYVLEPDSKFAKNLVEGLKILKDEIGRYDSNFLKIPAAVVITKMDLLSENELPKRISSFPDGLVFPISSFSGEGMEKLKGFLDKITKRDLCAKP